MGFLRNANEPTEYKKQQGNSDVLLLCLYMYDIVYMGLSEDMLREFKEVMTSKSKMTNLVQMKYFLGLEVNQFSDSLFVSQHKYAKDLLNRAGMKHYKSIGSPINSN